MTNELITFLEKTALTMPELTSSERFDSFTISGYPHYENVISNWLAFFFDTHNEHNFKGLFGDALKQAILKKGRVDNLDLDWLSYDDLTADREVQTEKGNYLDIVLYDLIDTETKEYENCLLIEHKINASLYNDLDDYYNSFKAIDSKVAIVLSAKEIETNNAHFINISYADFLKEIKPLLGNYQLSAQHKHILYLTDLLNNMEDHSSNITTEEIDFCFQHGQKVEEVIALKTSAENKLMDQVRTALSESEYDFNRKYPYSFSIKGQDHHVSINFSLNKLFSESKTEFQYWIRDEWVKDWNKIKDVSAITAYCNEVGFKPSKKKQGDKWAEIAKGTFVYDKSTKDFGVELLHFLNEKISPITVKVIALKADLKHKLND